MTNRVAWRGTCCIWKAHWNCRAHARARNCWGWLLNTSWRRLVVARLITSGRVSRNLGKDDGFMIWRCRICLLSGSCLRSHISYVNQLCESTRCYFCCNEEMRHRNIVEVTCGDNLKKLTPCSFVNICNMGTATSECSAHAQQGYKTATCTVRHARLHFNITCVCVVPNG